MPERPRAAMRVPDANLWIEFVRLKTPPAVKHQARAVLSAPDRTLCEPISFEVLRAAPLGQRPLLEAFFALLPLLPTPADLWTRATTLGQRCYADRIVVPALDLLIAQVCIEHAATLVTFDGHFDGLASVSELRVEKLVRAA